MISRRLFAFIVTVIALSWLNFRPSYYERAWHYEYEPLGPTLNGQRACTKNPYADVLENKTNHRQTALDDIIVEAQSWLDERYWTDITPRASLPMYSGDVHHNHDRFFPFEVMAECNDLQCIGGPCSDDLSKYMCGLSKLSSSISRDAKHNNEDTPSSCVIYSIGSNNEWQFELDLLEKTNCHIHTFDCTGKKERFEVPPRTQTGGRLTFHHICLGARKMKGIGDDHPDCDRKHLCGDTWTLADLQRELGHETIDLLKLDIEGWEWPLFDITHTDANMPMEILVEVHYNWAERGAKGVIHDNTMESATDLARFMSRLLGLGYIIVHRDDNPSCRHCSELTLVRVAC